MKTYIALLRGINVGGKTSIKMDILRSVLPEPDFVNVSTYIQSGNIVFQSRITDIATIQLKIRTIIENHFALDVPIIVILPIELLSVINNNPFAEEHAANPTQPYFSFLSETPDIENLKKLQNIDFGPDRFIANGKTLYIYYVHLNI